MKKLDSNIMKKLTHKTSLKIDLNHYSSQIY